MEISEQQVDEAVKQLKRSETGHSALRDIYAFLTRDGMRLDGSNQTAIVTLLIAAWGHESGTVKRKIWEAL